MDYVHVCLKYNNQALILLWVITDLIHSFFLSNCRPSIIPGPAPDELVIPATESVGLFHLIQIK